MEKIKVGYEPEVHERNEILQPIIDRLLYLSASDLETYKFYLKMLEDIYPLDVRVKDGIRIYHVKKLIK